jgi:hypothetical protein
MYIYIYIYVIGYGSDMVVVLYRKIGLSLADRSKPYL